MLKWGYFLEAIFSVHNFCSEITGPTRSSDMVPNWDQQTAQSDLVHHFHIWVIREGRSVMGTHNGVLTKLNLGSCVLVALHWRDDFELTSIVIVLGFLLEFVLSN